MSESTLYNCEANKEELIPDFVYCEQNIEHKSDAEYNDLKKQKSESETVDCELLNIKCNTNKENYDISADLKIKSDIPNTESNDPITNPEYNGKEPESKDCNSKCHTTETENSLMANFDTKNCKERSGCSHEKKSVIDKKTLAMEICLNDKFMQQNTEKHVICKKEIHETRKEIIMNIESYVQEQQLAEKPEIEKKQENNLKDKKKDNTNLHTEILNINSLEDNDSHVHFASPLTVYHEYSVSENSSRTETQESDSSETPKLELIDNSVMMKSFEIDSAKDLETFGLCNKLGNQKMSTCTTMEKNTFNTDSDSGIKSKDKDETDNDTSAVPYRKYLIKQFQNVNEIVSQNQTDDFQDVNEMVTINPSDDLIPTGGETANINDTSVIASIPTEEDQIILDVRDILECLILKCELMTDDFLNVNKMVTINPCDDLQKNLYPTVGETTNDTSVIASIPTEEDKVILEVRDILECIILKCEHECRNQETIGTFSLDVESCTQEGFGQISFQEGKEIEPFSNKTDEENNQQIKEDLTKFDMDDSDIIVSFKSVLQQSPGTTKNRENVLPSNTTSSAEHCNLIVVEHIDESLDMLNLENVKSQFEDNMVEDYETKAEILKTKNSEKLHLILSPQCIKSNTDKEISENIIQHSQGSAEVQSDSEFEIFDSEEESIESESEIQELNIEVEKSKLHDSKCDKTNDKSRIDENLETKHVKLTNKQNISLESHNTTNGDLIEALDLSRRADSSESHNENQELLENKTIEKWNENHFENASFNLDHEQCMQSKTVNDNLIGHLEQTQNNSPEKRIISDLICNVKEDDFTCIQTSENVSKTNSLDGNQESNASLSKSRNQLQEFNLSYERNKSELFNKQLTAENVHLSADSDDAKLQEMENTCIFEKKEELIKGRQNHLSFDNQGNNFSNRRSERKRSIDTDNVDDEAPSSKVSALIIGNNMQENLGVLRDDIISIDKEQEGIERQCVNKTGENICSAEDQAVPDLFVENQRQKKIDNVPETLYIPETDIKKHQLTIDIDEERMETHTDESTVLMTNQDINIKNPVQSFKWKYVPSVDLDSVVPNIDDAENHDIQAMPVPLQTCRKPYRLGLSKKQKLPSLHPKLKKI